MVVEILYDDPRIKRNIAPKAIDANKMTSWKIVIRLESAPANMSFPAIQKNDAIAMQHAMIAKMILMARSDIFMKKTPSMLGKILVINFPNTMNAIKGYIFIS